MTQYFDWREYSNCVIAPPLIAMSEDKRLRSMYDRSEYNRINYQKTKEKKNETRKSSM